MLAISLNFHEADRSIVKSLFIEGGIYRRKILLNIDRKIFNERAQEIMKLRSVLFFLVLGLTALDWTLALPVEIVDLEHMKTSIVDSSKAAEIIDDKDSDVEETVDGKQVIYRKKVTS